MHDTLSPPERPRGQSRSRFRKLVDHPERGWRRPAILFWALVGPGVLATLANNDAGGMISYTMTGARFGIGLFIPLTLCLGIATYTTQELVMRLSTVTQTGLARLIRLHFGPSWLMYHIISLCLANLLMMVTEFIGMTAGLIMLGLPFWVATVLSLLLAVSIIIFTGYWTRERIALLIGAVNIVFIVVAVMTRPSAAVIGHAFVSWNLPANSGNVFWYVAALIGNSVAPFAVFFQGSGNVDKGVIDRHIRLGRIDTLTGCIVETIVAACAIVAGAALFGRIPDLENAGPAVLIGGFLRHAGRWPAILFGLGIFNAGLLASFTVSLSTSWAVAESFGWARSLDDRISEAPGFYAIYIGGVVFAALIVLVPNLPLNFMAVAAQVVSGALMAPVLVFLLLLTNKRELMGRHANTLAGNIRAGTVTTVLIGIVALLLWSALTR